MLKFASTQIGFQEFPGEITLLINITNCPCHCEGCHSPYLAEDKGENLTYEKLHEMYARNHGAITCIGIMGGDCSHDDVEKLARFINDLNLLQSTGPMVKVGWYSGRDNVDDIDKSYFDYMKTGHYDRKAGPLNSPTTNQKMIRQTRKFVTSGWDHRFEITDSQDITWMFWEKEQQE